MSFDAPIRSKGNEPDRPVATPRIDRTRYSADSFNGEDPLSRQPHGFAALDRQPSRSATPVRTGSAPGKSPFAIVLSSTPKHNVLGATRVDDADDLGAESHVVSDVARGGKKVASAATSSRTPSTATGHAAPAARVANASQAPPASSARGRPKGWKPGMRYSVMRGKDPPESKVARAAKTGAHGPKVVKRRGRPAKLPSPPPTAIYGTLKPDFLAFLCEWPGCKAELHNLNTLRRHVYVAHGKGERCLWGECRDRDSPLQEFSNNDDFERHMEEAHLVPMGWHVGDGPLNSRTRTTAEKGDEGIPDFLKDRDGQQITPSVRDQEVEDTATWKNNRRKLAELLRKRDENLPDESDSAEGNSS